MAVDQVHELLNHPKPAAAPREFRATVGTPPANAAATTFLLDSLAREVETDVVQGESAIVQKLLKGLTVAALVIAVGAATVVMWAVGHNLNGYIVH
jgi:hypothetical protein